MGGALSEDFPVYLAGLREGSLLAGYRLEVPLGAGGMAVVFRAHDERLDRPVALKIFAPAVADKDTRQRFIHESRTAAAVDHPHIIPIYEAGEVRGFLFIAMRLVRGGDLCGLLKREGQLAPIRAAGIVSQVASALDAAHGAGLVHRDVKPGNILLAEPAGESDYVYLSDFGISKQAASSTNLTRTGQFLGTPDYAAPEQGGKIALDGRADQYALACVAYHLLTGAPPFEREGAWAVLMAHLSQPPPSVRERRPDLPETVDRVLSRALAKMPEDRYGSCCEFAAALRASLDLAPARSAVPAGPPAVAGPDWASAEQPADHSRQAIWVGSVPAKGSSLLGPPPPGAVSSRPRRSAVGRSRGVLRLGARSLLGLVLAAAVVLIIVMLVTHHSPKPLPASDQGHAPLAGPPVNPAQQPPGRLPGKSSALPPRANIDRHDRLADHRRRRRPPAVLRVRRRRRYVVPGPDPEWPAGLRSADGRARGRADRPGGPRGWLAEGPQAIWTSKNGQSWTLAATHGIDPQQPGDIGSGHRDRGRLPGRRRDGGSRRKPRGDLDIARRYDVAAADGHPRA